MRLSSKALVHFLACLLMLSSVSLATAQVAATIEHTSTAPVIDGDIDAIWSTATAHGTSEWNIVEGPTVGQPIPEADATVTWRALWDSDNLYVLAEATDDQINNLEFTPNWANRNWEDDSFEVYIDAQDTNVTDYTFGANPGTPAFQFTMIAGDDPTRAEDTRNFFGRPTDGGENSSSFSHGTNSYGSADATETYVQGSDTSTSKYVNVANDGTGGGWRMEVAFPWTSLDETPEDIMARGSFGFGVAYNDDDETDLFIGESEGRDHQYMWGTTANDLWMNAASMPEVALAPAAGGCPDCDSDGDVDGTDFLITQQDGASIGDWEAAYPSPVSAITGVPEPSTIALLVIGSLACQRALIRRQQPPVER